MSEKSIPVHHRVIAAATVKALFGDRAVMREMVVAPEGAGWRKRAGALHLGIRAFWNRWTQRRSNGGAVDETQD